MSIRHLMTTSIAAAAAMLCGAAYAQTEDSILQFSELWTEPQEFYLQTFTSNETFVFDSRRPVRICAATAAEAELPVMAAAEDFDPVPLEVRAGNDEFIVEPGDCHQFQAQRVTVSPAAAVDAGWTLRGQISTRVPQQS